MPDRPAHGGEGSLTARLVRGAGALLAGNACSQALRLARNLVLARLLVPEAFALMALVMSVNSLLLVVTGLGVREAVIQHPRGAERDWLNAAWWVGFARSSLVYATAFVLAPWLADFYGEPRLVALLRVACLGTWASGLLSPRMYVLLKDLRYGRWALMDQGAAVLGVGLAIGLAFVQRSVWALVFGYVAEAVFRVVFSHLIGPFHPGFRLRREDLQPLLRFSRGVLGINLLALVYTQCDVFALGKLVAKSDLGLYAMAASLARASSGLLGALVNPLLMPAFSRMQDDPERINRNLVRVTGLLATAAWPAFLGGALLAGPLLTVLFGPAYADVAAAFTILLLTDVLSNCRLPMVAVLFSLGRPDVDRARSLIGCAVILAAIVPCIRAWGLTGAALAMFAGQAAYTAALVQAVHGQTGLARTRYLWAVSGRAALALPAAAPVLAVRLFGPHLSPLAQVLVAGAGAAVVAAALAVPLHRHWTAGQAGETAWPRAAAG